MFLELKDDRGPRLIWAHCSYLNEITTFKSQNKYILRLKYTDKDKKLLNPIDYIYTNQGIRDNDYKKFKNILTY